MTVLPEVILSFLQDYAARQLPPALPELRVLVGVSGGPDSIALLHALHQLQNSPSLVFSLEVRVAHLNHLIRGESASQDAQYVLELSQHLHLKTEIAEYDVPAFAAANALSLENAARRVRFAFFACLLAQWQAPLLLLAHTANDQAETVLMRLLRGTGPHGLGGIAPLAPLPPPDARLASTFRFEPDLLKNVQVGRPLLNIWRNEIEAYCLTHGLEPRQDETNTEPRYTRNRIRLELLPRLETEYKPGVKNNLVRLANLMRDEQVWLDQLTEAEFERSAHFTGDNVVEFEADYFRRQPVALQRRLLRRAYLKLAESLENLEAADLEPLIGRVSILKKSLSGGLLGFSNSKTIGIRKLQPASQNRITPFELAIPGSIEIKPGWRLETTLISNEAISPERLKSGAQNIAYLDFERTGPRLLVRSRLAGEKFRPLGAPGRRKLQDMMTDAKIEREQRESWPLIVRPGEDAGIEKIVWLPGVAIADDFKVTLSTKVVLMINCSRF